uniref:Uncharacterized protein n=1 Tax=Anguilla anguilla TaxID=7936 RepID=A0A0E9X4U6_ANGAN
MARTYTVIWWSRLPALLTCQRERLQEPQNGWSHLYQRFTYLYKSVFPWATKPLYWYSSPTHRVICEISLFLQLKWCSL